MEVSERKLNWTPTGNGPARGKPAIRNATGMGQAKVLKKVYLARAISTGFDPP